MANRINVNMSVGTEALAALMQVLSERNIPVSISTDTANQNDADEQPRALGGAYRSRKMANIPANVANDLTRNPALADLVAMLESRQTDAGNQPSTRARKRADSDTPRKPKVLYAFTGRVTKSQLAKMELTPHMRAVMAYVLRRSTPASRDEIAQATGIERKSVESPIYQLRVTKPALLKSVSAE